MTQHADGKSLVDAYIAQYPPEVQEKLEAIRAAIRTEAPEATEAIKYGIPTLVMHGNLVHFAAAKDHIGFYPTPAIIETFAEELKGYVTLKGAVQFPLEDDLPLELVRRMVAARVREVQAASYRNWRALRR
ncbi:MAG: hypothetical protein GXY52_01160 [Chloroflexi bacterium]|nr:hypothetical protein [Chloroflexota bacterium]